MRAWNKFVQRQSADPHRTRNSSNGSSDSSNNSSNGSSSRGGSAMSLSTELSGGSDSEGLCSIDSALESAVDTSVESHDSADSADDDSSVTYSSASCRDYYTDDDLTTPPARLARLLQTGSLSDLTVSFPSANTSIKVRQSV